MDYSRRKVRAGEMAKKEVSAGDARPYMEYQSRMEEDMESEILLMVMP
tara:strand:+ start:1515 stop:1658 length:144 start_codon:yes stop_codon:yes gene_type:complete